MKEMCRIFSLIITLTLTINFMIIPSSAAKVAGGTIYNGGWYRIQHVGSGKYLHIADGSKKNGAKLQLYDLSLDNSSVFQIISCDNGTIKFISYNSGKVIEVNGSSKKERAAVQQWTDKGYKNSLWLPECDENGYYSFKNINSNMYLNVEGNCSENNTRLIQYKWDGTTAEKFRLIELDIKDVSDATWTTYGDDVLYTSDNNHLVINTTGFGSNTYIPQNGQRFLYSVSYISHDKLIDIVCDSSKKDTISELLLNFSINEITDLALEEALGKYAIFGRLFCALLNENDNKIWNQFIDCAQNALHNTNNPGLDIRTYVTIKYEYDYKNILYVIPEYDYTSEQWYGGHDNSLSRFESNGDWELVFGYHNF